EAISNARRHAAATRVEVIADEQDGALDLVIRDNGRGFVVIPDARLTSLGLRSMRERASALGGTVTVTSMPGQGTTVRAMLPMATAP
ncbi:MAG: ATP-binding protein, partial [Gemmatimonadota bacterium]